MRSKIFVCLSELIILRRIFTFQFDILLFERSKNDFLLHFQLAAYLSSANNELKFQLR